MPKNEHYMIVGGAGFIGSHLSRHLFETTDSRITIYDNFSSGTHWRLNGLEGADRVRVIKGDVKDLEALCLAMCGITKVYHFAANPDIAKAVTQPDIDFWEGTYLVQNLLEAMRMEGVKSLFYASGSGVYGDAGTTSVHENYAPLLPISTYGASKLACEALICSYCHMFGMTASAFRFANVVGPRQTHGVAFDFIRRLKADPTTLHMLGDGTQSKSYISVSDVISAMRSIEALGQNGYDFFNVATGDYVTVCEIADIIVRIMKLEDVEYTFSGGARGWKGDVPIVRFESNKIRGLGWRNHRSSKEAIEESVTSMLSEYDILYSK